MRLRLLLAVSLGFSLLGCAGNGEVGVETDVEVVHPAVTATFSRTELPFNGGQVQITVTISDPSGVASAEIDISPRPFGFTPLAFEAQDRPTTITRSVAVTFPLNSSASDVVYRVTVKAKNALGNERTVTVGTVRVARLPFGNLPPNPSGTFPN